MAYINYLELTFSILSFFKGFYDNSKRRRQQYLAAAKFAKRQNTEYPLICCTSAVRLQQCVAAQVPVTRDVFFSYLLVLSLNTYFSLTIRGKQSAGFMLFLKSLDEAFGNCLSQALLPSSEASYNWHSRNRCCQDNHQQVSPMMLAFCYLQIVPSPEPIPATYKVHDRSKKMSHRAAHCTGVGGQIS